MGDQELKVVIVGSTASGKSSLIRRFIKDEFTHEANPSVEVERHNFATAMPMLANVNFTLWDTFDHVQYHNAVLQYCKTAQVCVVVYDTTSAESWARATEWVEELRASAGLKAIIALVGNKIDKSQSGVDVDRALAFAVENDTLFHECSAKTGAGVQSLFTDIAISALCEAPLMSARERVMQTIQRWRRGIEEKIKRKKQSRNQAKHDTQNEIQMTDMNDTACTAKVVLVGESNVGKTSIAVRFTEGTYKDRPAPTIGNSYLTHRIRLPADNTVVDINLWDTAGQEKFYCLVPMYFRQAQGAIIVYDITSLTSFKRAKDWAKAVRREHEHITSIALVGNKIDASDMRQVSTDEARLFAKSLGLIFIEASAKTGENVRQIFEEVATQIERRSADAQPSAEDGKVTLNGKRRFTMQRPCCAAT